MTTTADRVAAHVLGNINPLILDLREEGPHTRAAGVGESRGSVVNPLAVHCSQAASSHRW